MFRLFLPPNLGSAAPRDAIALKVELDLTAPPAPEWLPALALLQRWCATPTPPAFLQLTRAQLRQLVTALSAQPVFFWINQPQTPLVWIGPFLRGVSEHLQEATAAVGVVSPAATKAPVVSSSAGLGATRRTA